MGWGGGEKLGIKLKLSFSWGLGLAELAKNKYEVVFLFHEESAKLILISGHQKYK